MAEQTQWPLGLSIHHFSSTTNVIDEQVLGQLSIFVCAVSPNMADYLVEPDHKHSHVWPSRDIVQGGLTYAKRVT